MLVQVLAARGVLFLGHGDAGGHGLLLLLLLPQRRPMLLLLLLAVAVDGLLLMVLSRRPLTVLLLLHRGAVAAAAARLWHRGVVAGGCNIEVGLDYPPYVVFPFTESV